MENPLNFAESKWIKVMFAQTQTVMVRLKQQSVNSVITGNDKESSPGGLKYKEKDGALEKRGAQCFNACNE